MTLNYVRAALTFTLLFSLVLPACAESGTRPPPDQIINIGADAGAVGCSQPSFPSEQPDMSPLFPPEFVTEDGLEQRQIRPGQDILAEVTVNGATRKVFVEITDTWTPDLVILATELDTTGNETIPITLPTTPTTRGWFFMRVILCGDDCRDREVVFDLIEPDLDNQANTGINANYERTLIENSEVVQVDETCIRPNPLLIQ